MHIERKILDVSVFALVGVVIVTGCIVDDEDIQFRDGNNPSASDPIPGGGPCKRCIRGFRQQGNVLELCVDTTVEYIHDVIQDGTPLLGLLTGPTMAQTWELIVDVQPSGNKNYCEGEECKAKVKGPTDERFVVAELPVTSNWTPPADLSLVLTAHEEVSHGPDFTRMPRLLLEPAPLDSKWPCDPAYKEPSAQTAGLMQTSPPTFMAQIAFPWFGGGVRSCSGVLISPRHILTAAHCFDHEFHNVGRNFARHIDVRFGMTPWWADGSIAKVTLHDDYHYADGSIVADVAIVELDSEVDPMIEPAYLPSSLGVQTGGFRVLGYGVQKSLETIGFDWGGSKDVRDLKPNPVLADAENLEQFLVLSHVNKSALRLCQGDSGGPVLTQIDGAETIVAILSARIVKDQECASQEQVCGNKLETMGSALAFNHGNACGEIDDSLGYAATIITPEISAWIDSQLGTSPLPMM